VLRECANNGLSLGSNVVNGSGPTKNISLDVDRTRITGNRGGNLGIRNFTRLTSLSVKVQRSDLANSPGPGSSVADVSAEDLGVTQSSTIDLGGGPLGSTGGNCTGAGLLVADVIRFHVWARHGWWGQPGGPGLLSALALEGTIDTRFPLDEAPAWCR